MLFILTAVIVGTYLFYKGSIRFLFNLVRKKKNGYLTIKDVLSLSSIMFRMKSNALLLTIITTVSALAIGLLSLSYISYYSVERTAQNNVAADFSFANQKDYAAFKDLLAENQITFTEKEVEIVQAYTDLSDVMGSRYFAVMDYNQHRKTMAIISETAIEGLDLAKDEAMMSGFSDDDANLYQMKDSGKLTIEGPNGAIEQSFKGMKREYLVSSYFTSICRLSLSISLFLMKSPKIPTPPFKWSQTSIMA